MSFRVTLAPAAARQLRKHDPQVRRRLQAALDLLAVEPRPPAATRLVGGAGEWRVRTGDYRIIYEINDPTNCSSSIQVDTAVRFISGAAELLRREHHHAALGPAVTSSWGHEGSVVAGSLVVASGESLWGGLRLALPPRSAADLKQKGGATPTSVA